MINQAIDILSAIGIGAGVITGIIILCMIVGYPIAVALTVLIDKHTFSEAIKVIWDDMTIGDKRIYPVMFVIGAITNLVPVLFYTVGKAVLGG